MSPVMPLLFLQESSSILFLKLTPSKIDFLFGVGSVNCIMLLCKLFIHVVAVSVQALASLLLIIGMLSVLC